MEQHGVGEDSVEATGRQFKLEEILLQDLATAVLASHLCKALGAVETNGDMAHAGERLEITTRPTTEIQHGKWRATLDMPQQCIDVLANIVIAGALTKAFCRAVVMVERGSGDGIESVGSKFHGGGMQD